MRSAFRFPFLMCADENPSLPSLKYYGWFENLIVWINKKKIFFLSFFLLCVFFKFQKSSWLICCRRILGQCIAIRTILFGVGAILTDNHLLGGYCCLQALQLWYGLLNFCECYAAKSLQVVRSAHRPWTCKWYVYYECNWIKSHDSSANMCCVIFAIYYGYQGLHMYLLSLNVGMNII